MEVSILASGSSGNAVLFCSGSSTVLVDAGISALAIRRRLAACGRSIAEVGAIALTHEHSDHVRGVEVLVRHNPLPVWATPGTWSALELKADGGGELLSGRSVRLGGLELTPVATSHDAAEPVAMIIDDGDVRVGLCTDTGVMTPLLIERLRGCDLLLLEANHDADLLRHGPYPWVVKQRIASRHGHLANHQAQDALDQLAGPALKAVIGMHLSAENNRPELVEATLRSVLPTGITVTAATRSEMLQLTLDGGSVELVSRPLPPTTRRRSA
ncbi:MAG: MBL fold metallo-hydrolase, partial [Acidobacteria bacterium]|nr:MBL fold metallo-hydrolase [Acidobacteriota bacterium]